jgi:hypothetical protein
MKAFIFALALMSATPAFANELSLDGIIKRAAETSRNKILIVFGSAVQFADGSSATFNSDKMDFLTVVNSVCDPNRNFSSWGREDGLFCVGK